MKVYSGWTYGVGPHFRLFASLSISWTQATLVPPASGGDGDDSWAERAPMDRMNSVTILRARQSSMLYVMSSRFHSSSRVASHRILQAMLWTPEAPSLVHSNPRQRATSFRPLE